MARRGFATLTAIVLMGVIVTSLTLVLTVVRTEVRSSAKSKADTQLDALLIAGVVDLDQRSRAWGPATPTEGWSVPVPKELVDAKIETSVPVTEGAQTCSVTLAATVNGRSASQQVRLRREADGWHIIGAERD